METDRRTILSFAAIAAALPWANVAEAAEAADGKIYVIAELLARPGQEATVRTALSNFARGVPKEAGCLSYHLHEDVAAPGRFLTYEVWKDKAAIDAHFQTPAMKAAGPALAKLLAKPLGVTSMKLLV
ncbi:putative quinol monooxygenase [Sphingomonas sp. GB1N7]|uniref:putative quinol monooxygenase n=1 Tax=Parasphingomonas caseinilytica TaxID=3096158 RepID=UPI002FC6482F